jgi:hypothetical protein
MTEPKLMLPPRQVHYVPGESGTLEQFADQCEAHNTHFPLPLVLEEHHVVPQDWQDEWYPSGAHVGKLWAPTTVKLCRTGHGNVHFWLVLFMHEYETMVESGMPNAAGTIDAACRNVLHDKRGYQRGDTRIAKQGMVNFTTIGGNLMTLCRNKSYGAMYG